MSSDGIQDGSAYAENASSAEVEGESNNIDSLEVVSSSGGITRELEHVAESLTRIELDLACSSEKLVNLDILVMHVASRENDFEAFASNKVSEGSVNKALEFDLLYGFLDSEIRELEGLLSALQTEIASYRGNISSFNHLGDSLKEVEEKLQDCEEALKQSTEQVSDIKFQSANFQRILLNSSVDEKWKDDKDLAGLEYRGTSDANANIKMQTAEQQRHVLKMLEKSLAREMDLEKKLAESRQAEEDLTLRFQQEILCIEEETEDIWGRLFVAENSSDILLEISRELLGRIQMAQKREAELNSELQDRNRQLKEKDSALLDSESSRTELMAKVNLLEQRLGELERVEYLERQLKDSEIKRLHAEASAEASQEKQNMLDCTIKDMESLIKDLKLKVLKGESQIESAEEKCIILSESNAELMEEMNYLRGKVKSLETSLHQAAEEKKATAKDIKVQTQLIADLIMQLALERERLHKQISSLTEKKVAVRYSQQVDKDPSIAVDRSHDAEIEVLPRDLSPDKIEMDHDDSTCNPDTVRNIDARQLSFKHLLMAILVLLIPVFAAILLKQNEGFNFGDFSW